ncbi:phosphoadenylyl-sulfate reductase [Aquisalimonas sp. 2447]|uniref:phosphoadenylyl-sulfate reductase n=1 Tax=Aquisalimonas sp. 2447 TaxID=2740807 RepID=UPI001432317A|nr:phosphoadenylyl-sulfate reductase [Aquisalimonas sp. 2447]QIT56608.1 phosphoadenylyl-sulfate reductase [Aquisalimonas sp. 2447]
MTNSRATVAPLPEGRDFDLEAINTELEQATAQERVQWGLEQFGQRIVLSSSFGAQAAVSLHMVTRARPDIPVILVDTGYLFPETYRFVDDLTERLGLNLHVYRNALSPAWQEARYGKLWEQGVDGIDQYNRMNKVEPMQRALAELRAEAWFAGLRRQQASSREGLDVVAEQNGRFKVHPLIDWTDRDVYRYLVDHDLPYHPLWHQGYVSIGDVHTTRRLDDGMTEEETRFFGLKRECGLHEHV